MKYNHLKRFAIVLVFSIQACGTATIRMDTIPELKGGSPLRSIKPLDFAIKDFGNEAGEAVGKDFGSLIVMNKPPTILVTQTIGNELRRNGHRVMDPQTDTQPDVIMDGSVMKFHILMTLGRFQTQHFHAEVKISVRLTKPKKPTESFIKEYAGSGKCLPITRAVISDAGWRDCFNDALIDMVKDLTTDPDFIHALEKAN